MSKQTSMVEFFAKDSDDFFKKWRLCERTECVDSKNTHYHQIIDAAPAARGCWIVHDGTKNWRNYRRNAASGKAFRQDPYERKISDLAKKAKKLCN